MVPNSPHQQMANYVLQAFTLTTTSSIIYIDSEGVDILVTVVTPFLFIVQYVLLVNNVAHNEKLGTTRAIKSIWEHFISSRKSLSIFLSFVSSGNV